MKSYPEKKTIEDALAALSVPIEQHAASIKRINVLEALIPSLREEMRTGMIDMMPEDPESMVIANTLASKAQRIQSAEIIIQRLRSQVEEYSQSLGAGLPQLFTAVKNTLVRQYNALRDIVALEIEAITENKVEAQFQASTVPKVAKSEQNFRRLQSREDAAPFELLKVLKEGIVTIEAQENQLAKLSTATSSNQAKVAA